MNHQQLSILLIQLIALLFPFLAVLLRMAITEVDEIQSDQVRVPIQDVVLLGGGFSIVFLLGATILLVQVIRRTTGAGVDTPFGLALTLLLVSLVIFGAVTLVFLWGVLVADRD